MGYDAAWRSSNVRGEAAELPHGTGVRTEPFWKKTNDPKGEKLWEAYERDFTNRMDWHYGNYIVGFQDTEACIKRLLA